MSRCLLLRTLGEWGTDPQSLRNVVQVFQIKSEEGDKPTARKEEKKDETI